MLLRSYAPTLPPAAAPAHDVWRPTDPDSFFDLSESLIILPVNYFAPLIFLYKLF